jgi:hypothetical protein
MPTNCHRPRPHLRPWWSRSFTFQPRTSPFSHGRSPAAVLPRVPASLPVALRPGKRRHQPDSAGPSRRCSRVARASALVRLGASAGADAPQAEPQPPRLWTQGDGVQAMAVAGEMRRGGGRWVRPTRVKWSFCVSVWQC